jgi:uncharacterized pyridoxal phosphate-containing UPF0001 family protein
MTLGPLAGDHASSAAAFARLRLWSEALRAEFALHSLTELSMGMSNDWQIAVAEGATIVRIGTALFGGRT